MKLHVIVIIICATHMREDNNIVINTKTTASAGDTPRTSLSHLGVLTGDGDLIVIYLPSWFGGQDNRNANRSSRCTKYSCNATSCYEYFRYIPYLREKIDHRECSRFSLLILMDVESVTNLYTFVWLLSFSRFKLYFDKTIALSKVYLV